MAKITAKTWLKWIRQDVQNYPIIIGYLEKELDRQGLTLKEIGSSEKEIEDLKNKSEQLRKKVNTSPKG